MKILNKKNMIRFSKEAFWRSLNKIVDIVVLFGVGYALGMKLVH